MGYNSIIYNSGKNSIDKKWVEYSLGELNKRIFKKNKIDIENSIVINPVNKNQFHKILENPNNRVEWYSTSLLLPPNSNIGLPHKIPIIFKSDESINGNNLIIKNENKIIFNFDIIAATFFMLSRFEEIHCNEKDEHCRFPFDKSFAYINGFLDRPIIDEYALIIQNWIKHLFPNWELPKNQFKFNISHDIDLLYDKKTFTSNRQIIRNIKKYIIFFDYRKLFQVLFKGLKYQFGIKVNKRYLSGIETLISLLEKNNLKSTFYFMGAKKQQYDQGYDISEFKDLIKNITDRNHEIGFHPGYHTMDDGKKMSEEKIKIDQILQKPTTKSRQHYLRFIVPTTYWLLINCGIKYDSTLGYSKVNGFRAGTCYPFRPYDIKKNIVIPIIENPLVVMDKTLIINNITENKIRERFLFFANICKTVGGQFNFLLHNNTISEVKPALRNLIMGLIHETSLLERKDK